MIGREDFDECPKCHNTAIHMTHSYGPDAITTTARFCDCQTAKWYLARLYSSFALKSRSQLVARDILERMAQSQKPQ